MTPGADFASLFERGLVQWGMRGDPRLWEAMRRDLEGVPMPSAFWDVRSTVQREFERITGHRLADTPEPVRVAEFVTGSGMSDGHVLPTFWVRTAIPVLIDRWAAATWPPVPPADRDDPADPDHPGAATTPA